MAVIVKVSRTRMHDSETLTLYEHLLSVMSGRWVNYNWTQYSGSTERTNIVNIVTNLYNRQFINLSYSQSRQ